MRTATIFALVATAAAIPMARRDVTSLVTETIYTTIDIPVTLWVDENGNPIATSVAPGNFLASTTSTFIASTTSAVVAAPTTASSAVESSTATTVVSTAVSTAPVAAAVVPTTTITSAAPITTTTLVPATTSSTAAAAVVSDSTSVSASATNDCEGEGEACLGDITYYDGGLGACGWNVDPTAMSIALPYAFMGTQSNGNPYCGRSLTILNPTTGATIQATVGDKCMGCEGRAIDLTPSLFQAIGPECDGRCHGFEWWFN